MTEDQELGARLRETRYHADMPLEAVAVKLGVSARTVRDWETGHHAPRLIHLRRLAALYGVTASHFFENGE